MRIINEKIRDSSIDLLEISFSCVIHSITKRELCILCLCRLPIHRKCSYSLSYYFPPFVSDETQAFVNIIRTGLLSVSQKTKIVVNVPLQRTFTTLEARWAVDGSFTE